MMSFGCRMERTLCCPLEGRAARPWTGVGGAAAVFPRGCPWCQSSCRLAGAPLCLPRQPLVPRWWGDVCAAAFARRHVDARGGHGAARTRG